MPTHILKIKLIPTFILEILLIYCFKVLSESSGMSDHTYLIFKNKFVASMDMPEKKPCMVPILGVIHLVPGFMPQGRRLFLQVLSWC